MTGRPAGAARQDRHPNPPPRAPLHGAVGHLSGPALRLLIGVSVYREAAGRNALLFQIGQAGHADAPGPAAQCPAPPYHAPADLAELVSECEDAGLLVVPQVPCGQVAARGDIPPVFVNRLAAGVLHRDLAAAGRGDEVTTAHQRAAEYWQWRAAAWPQDRYADLHDLLEGRHHLHEAGDNDRAGTLTEVVCAQLHAWGELDHEAALIRETLAWLPPRSPLRAAWIQEIGKIAQVQGNYAEAERRYRQSLEMFASLGDTDAVSRSQHRLGVLAQARGDYAEAERRYQQALDLSGQPDPAAAACPGLPGYAEPSYPDAADVLPHDAEAQDVLPRSRDVLLHDAEAQDVLPRDLEARDVPPRDLEARDVLPCGTEAPRAGYTDRASGRRNGRHGGRRHDRPNELLCLTGTALAAAVVLTGLSAAGFTRFLPHGGSAPAARPAAARPASAATVRQQAAGWIAQQIGRGAIVSCDPAMCAALRAQGIPAGNLLMLGPSAEDPLGSDVVVATAAIRSQFGSRLTGVYAPEVAAAFGTGNASIQIRVVAPDGTIAYRNALRADLLARKAAGIQLLRNKDIVVTATVRKQLTAGQVDSRLLTTLAALAAQHALRIVAFADSGPGASPGTPLRMAQISAAGTAGSTAAGTAGSTAAGTAGGPAGSTASASPGSPASPASQAGPASQASPASPAGPADAGFLRSVLAFLHAQRPPYLAASIRTARIGGGQEVVQVEFASPSPLGLLAAGDASAGTSP